MALKFHRIFVLMFLFSHFIGYLSCCRFTDDNQILTSSGDMTWYVGWCYVKIVVLYWESAEIKWSIIQNNQIDPDDHSLTIVAKISLQHFPSFFFYVQVKEILTYEIFYRGLLFFWQSFCGWNKTLSSQYRESSMAAAPWCRTRGKQEIYQKRVMDGLLLQYESIAKTTQALITFICCQYFFVLPQ